MTTASSPSVLSVVSEIFPFIKTGGLADVTGALPLALAENGIETATLVPGYPSVVAALTSAEAVLEVDELFGGPARLLSGRASAHDLLVLEAHHLFTRPGNPYFDSDGRDWPDNALRFGALGWVAARIARGAIAGYRPDILHCHDWQAGLTLAYLAFGDGPRPGTVMTIHNLGYQGIFPSGWLGPLGLPSAAFDVDGVEFYGQLSFLKSGLQYADRITTVSPTYAAEMQRPENGFGLDGLLRARSNVILGITNGIDVNVWNPIHDPLLAARFDLATLQNRAENKVRLQRHFALREDADQLLFGVVSRLAWQKGLDLLIEAAPALLELDAQLAVLGTGEPELERRLTSLASAHKGLVGCLIGYDEGLAHLMQAGADSILVPSRYEPCGLTQLYALRYGAVPLVSKVGGLADTVLDPEEITSPVNARTGFHFSPVTQLSLEAALVRAREAWSNKEMWRTMQLNGMRTDVSWARSAETYATLYAELL